MTQEEKQLLLTDLSARVFYGVKVNIERDFPNNPQFVERIAKDGEIIVNGILAYDFYYYKPYLRPMSSMTEEERKEYEQWLPDGYCIDTFDWLNAHHFDYRGLISMGLALEAPEGMYKTDLEMSKARQINFEQAVYDAFGQVKDFTLAMRIARYFYEQAEKDLALTLEDIKKLDDIMDSMRTYTAWDAVDYPNDEVFYSEVQKRFNEIRKK